MNQAEIKHMHTRYMGGVGLTCLSRVYHQPIKQIYDAIKKYQKDIDRGTAEVCLQTRRERDRATQVLPRNEPNAPRKIRKSAKRQNQNP